MNKEKIEKIIENLAKNGYHLDNKTIKDNLIKLNFGNYCKFTFHLENEPLLIEAIMPIEYGVTFDQENVNFLNSITTYWSIYKHWLEFKFTPKSEEDLENTLLQLLESYN